MPRPATPATHSDRPSSSRLSHSGTWRSRPVVTARNNDATNAANAARLDAAKAGTQVYAQLTSSAYGMMHTSAGISGSSSMSVGYSYGGDVNVAVDPVRSVG